MSTQTSDCIQTLNTIANDLPDLIKKHQPKCIILFNHGEDSYAIHLCLLAQSKSFIHFHDQYKMDCKDDNAYALEDLDYDGVVRTSRKKAIVYKQYISYRITLPLKRPEILCLISAIDSVQYFKSISFKQLEPFNRTILELSFLIERVGEI